MQAGAVQRSMTSGLYKPFSHNWTCPATMRKFRRLVCVLLTASYLLGSLWIILKTHDVRSRDRESVQRPPPNPEEPPWMDPGMVPPGGGTGGHVPPAPGPTKKNPTRRPRIKVVWIPKSRVSTTEDERSFGPNPSNQN